MKIYENKKKEFDKEFHDFYFICASCFFFSCPNLGHDGDTSHTRRASEKSKKRMKMADLKAFVETKLLSKSEKALEKIGQEDSKMLFDQVIDEILLNFHFSFNPFSSMINKL